MRRQVRKMQYAVRAIGRRKNRKEFAKAAKRFNQKDNWKQMVHENQGSHNNKGRLVAYG